MLVEIKAASLNFPDLLIVQNKYQIKPPLPFVPGSEYAGVVEAVGEGVTQLKVGERSLPSGTGGFGTHAIAPAALCMPLPRRLPVRGRRRLHHDLRHLAPRAGRPRAAEGRRDGAGARRGRRRRHRGDPDRQGGRRARDRRGVDRREVRAVPLDRRRRDHQLQPAATSATRIKAATDGKGPDVIYDPVGGDFAEPAFRSIAWRGRYLWWASPRADPRLPLNLALLKGASIVGVFWGDFSRREPKANAAMMAELAQWYAQGKVKPVIDRTCRWPS